MNTFSAKVLGDYHYIDRSLSCDILDKRSMIRIEPYNSRLTSGTADVPENISHILST